MSNDMAFGVHQLLVYPATRISLSFLDPLTTPIGSTQVGFTADDAIAPVANRSHTSSVAKPQRLAPGMGWFLAENGGGR
jgi:hypothetical protein